MATEREKAQQEKSQTEASAKARETERQKDEQAEHNRLTPSADSQAGAKADLSEGDVRALRAEAGMDQLAGHESQIHVWSRSEAGKKFAETEKDREEQYKAEEKAYAEQHDDKGVGEAEKRYFEAVQ